MGRPQRSALTISSDRSRHESLARLRQDLSTIIQAALAAVAPRRLMRRGLDDVSTFIPAQANRVDFVAAGKAAGGMASSFLEYIGPRAGWGLIAHPPGNSPAIGPRLGLEIIEAGHPTPTEGSVRAGTFALRIAANTAANGHLVVLLSGGASALLAAPVDSITLDDKRAATNALLEAGADIGALNTVRKHLSKIKGGGLAASCRGSVLTLAISDVVGDDPSSIGSGPTVADPSTFADALDVVRRLRVAARVPPAVLQYLEAGAHGARPETPKPADPRLTRSTFRLIGSARDAVEAARRTAESLGYTVVVRADAITGEARDAAAAYVGDVEQRLQASSRPACVVSFGETTVSVRGKGRGGRNQEFALAAASAMPSLGEAAALASVGSDGVDGPTDAAGAIVDSTTPARARAAGLDPQAYLDNNDAYYFFTPLGDLVNTGPTGTNVGDIQIALIS